MSLFSINEDDFSLQVKNQRTSPKQHQARCVMELSVLSSFTAAMVSYMDLTAGSVEGHQVNLA